MVPKDIMERAVTEVLINKRAFYAVAKEFQIPHVTLRRYCLKHGKENNDGSNKVTLSRYGYFNNRSVFTPSQEILLAEYLLKALALYNGLTPEDVRKLAYNYAAQAGLAMPGSWVNAKQAGADWFSAFLKRHPELALRTQENTSLSRATSFNRHNVNTFYDKYSSLLERYCFTPEKIWNLDETGCTTVQKTKKIIAATGIKQVGAMVSSERGILITLCCAINPLSAHDVYIRHSQTLSQCA